jgi:hypothetical protein
MNRPIAVTRAVVLTAGVVQLVLGALFWAHVARSLVPLHIVVGLVLVLALWTLAGLAARAGAPVALVLLAIVWGLLLPFVGFSQADWLHGSLHWLIDVLHLVLGLIAMGLAEMLSAASKRRRAAAQAV